MGGFRAGLLVGGLAVAVVGLIIALLGALNDSGGNQKTVIVKKTETARPERSSGGGADGGTPRSRPGPRSDGMLERVAFTSPIGNLICLMTSHSVKCAASEFEYTPPAEPSSCSLPGWGHVVGVGKTGAGEFICTDNAPADPSSPALPYGKGVLLGSFACASKETGIRCANRDTRHGFQIAREQIQLF